MLFGKKNHNFAVRSLPLDASIASSGRLRQCITEGKMP